MPVKTISTWDIAKAMVDEEFASRRGVNKMYGPNLTPLGLVAAGGFSSSRGYVTWGTDFLEIVANQDLFTTTKDAGGTTLAIAAGINGRASVITGGTITDGVGMIGQAAWKGDNNCLMLVRMQSDVVTNITLEAGFVNNVTDKTTPAVTDIDVPTFQAAPADAAVLTMDTGETLTTFALATIGSTPYAAAKTTLSNGGPGIPGVVATTFAPTAATDFTLMIAIGGGTTATSGDNVLAAIFDANDRCLARAYKPLGIEGATAIAPWISVACLTAASKTLSMDYVYCMQDRYFQ